MYSLFAVFLTILSSIPVAEAEDIFQSNSPTVIDGLLFVSTIDGYLRAVEPHSGTVKWSLKEDPVLVSPKTIQHGFTFLPDPQDGGLYVLKDGQLKKLPYSIPQLVTASPCRTTDGVLYAGSKRDVWLEIDPDTGAKLDELSLAETFRQCPLSKNTTVFIGRSEYKLTMFDPENRERRWNATFTDYSSHLMPADPSYPFRHFTSAVDGRLVTVNESEGSVAWEVDVGATVVAMYILQRDGLHRLPYTVIGKETLEEFVKYPEELDSLMKSSVQGSQILKFVFSSPVSVSSKMVLIRVNLQKDPWRNGLQAWIDDVSHRSPTETTTAPKLFPTLYVGESFYGLFAMPAFVDGRTVTIAPKYLGPPLLEGPTPIAVKNQDPQPRSNPSTRPIALIDLDIAKITHKTVEGEFLVLGYHEPPQLAASQLIPRRPVRQPYPSLTFVNSDKQSEETSSVRAIEAGNKRGGWSLSALWENDHLVVVIAISSTAVIFVVTCCVILGKLQNRDKESFLELEARYAQTSKSLGIFWRARQMPQLPDGWLQTGNIMYNPEDRLGNGCEGTIVFRGKFDGREVAVKRVIADIRLAADREVDLLRESDTHPNVIRYFCMESDSNFRYIALELCDYSLFDYVEKEGIREHCPLSDMDILHQATKGLAYLHSINIVHRDMKPQNVLLSRGATHDGVRALISDFGLCKRLQAGRNSLSRRSGPIGTDGWIAPEALVSDASVTCAVDVFSLGCIYYYVLTGKHPFGEPIRRQGNILQGEYSLKLLSTTSNLVGVSLIESMIRHNPQMRPTTAALAKHPFFWSKEQQLRFFMDVSDRIEKLDEQNFVVRRLEENAHRAVGYNWRQKICPALAADLRKFRTYQGNTVRDLLRAMRNKKHHYRELPPEVQDSLGQVPEQFVTYFTGRFPKLLEHTYQAMLCCANEHSFTGYYSDEARKMAGEVESNTIESEIQHKGSDELQVESQTIKPEIENQVVDELKAGVDESAFVEGREESGQGEWIEVGAPKPKVSSPQAGRAAVQDPTAAGNDSQQIRKRRRRPRKKVDKDDDGRPNPS